jgi:hypothetical protein
MAPQDQFRQGQVGFVNQLQNMANGQGPSLVQNQLQQATDQNLAQQQALAASARGGNSGMAQRIAAQNAGNIQQQAAQQSAGLRQQEMLGAYGMLGNQLASARGQDIGLATGQAQIGLGAQGQQDSFTNALVNSANQRDIASAQLDEESKKRRAGGTGAFANILGGLGSAVTKVAAA